MTPQRFGKDFSEQISVPTTPELSCTLVGTLTRGFLSRRPASERAVEFIEPRQAQLWSTPCGAQPIVVLGIKLWCTTPVPLDTLASRMVDIVALLAGHIAEDRACDRALSQKVMRESSDFTLARKCLNEFNRDYPTFDFDCATAARLAVSIVAARWDEILTLAAELFARRSLSGESVRMILGIKLGN
jgi:hypothetical protein